MHLALTLRSGGLVLLGLGLAASASAAPADSSWQGSGTALTGPPMTTSVVADGSAGAAVFEYDNQAPDVGGGGASGSWEFSTVASSTRTVNLTYDYQGFHAFFQVRVSLEAFVDDGESVTVVPLVATGPADCPPCTAPSAGFAYTGDVSLSVHAGDRYGFRMTGSNGDLNSRLRGLLTVDGPAVAEDPGRAVLVQAVPSGTRTFVAAQVTGTPGTTRTLQLLTSATCSAGLLGADAALFASVPNVTFDARGEAYLAQIVENLPAVGVGTYAAARVTGGATAGAPSPCIVAGPDNDTWTRAAGVALTGSGTVRTGAAAGFLDSAGNARWYRFTIQPGAQASIELAGLPADYDLAVFKDIAQAFAALNGDTDVGGLDRLGAEFAPSVFSPSVFSPSVFSPSVFSPDAYAPSVFSPSVFSPSVFSPSVFSPSVFSPSVFSPSVFSPSVFSPSVFSPSVFSPSVFSPSVFSPSVFSPDSFASAQTRSLIAVAAQPGTGTERVVADTWNNTGSFYVRVTGKNGAFDRERPFQLAVRLDGALCNGVAPMNWTASAVAGGYETLILWDSSRMNTSLSGNSPSQVAALRARLNTLAGRNEVRGAVVDLSSIAQIRALHTQADAHSACPYAENLTALGIKKIVDAYRQINPALAYVVIAGSDAQVPFFRYPDQGLLGPEQDYDPPMANGTRSQSALRLNYVLGQDEYGASISLSLRDGQFPVPDLAVGRLVETAAEMSTVLDAYLATSDGVVPQPTSTLVTGYDFLADAADAVQSELVAGTVGAVNHALITPAEISPADPRSWTADALRHELLDQGDDIVFLAGHFSANSALAADYRTTALATELAASNVDLTNSLVFSAGCHSGYNIVDGDTISGVTEPLDWTEAFARKGATLVAGTGYQYGDTDFVEYSERLYVQFARELRTGFGPVSVGQALVRAKQHYLSATPDIRGLHRKSVLISTVFGLPMLRLDLAGERIDDDTGGSEVVSAPVSAGPGAQLGLQSADLMLQFPDVVERSVALTDLTGGSLTATYLEGPDGVITNPAEPALPLVSRNVTVPGLSLRGVGLRRGSWSERSVVPLTGAPTTELRGVHTPFASLVNFPMRLATPNYYGSLAGTGGTVLHVTPAQHRVASIGNRSATLRQFDDLSFRLFYSDNTQTYGPNVPALVGPPTLSGVRAVTDGNDVVFLVNVVGAPSAGIQGVWVTYTDGGASSGQWRSLDLVQDPVTSTQWSGRLVNAVQTFVRLDYLAQAVNGVGLVALDDNYGAYYRIVGALGQVDPNGVPDGLVPSNLALSGPGSGVYGASIALQATLRSGTSPVAGASVLFTLGGTGRVGTTNAVGVASATLPLTAVPGAYTLTVSFAGDGSRGASSDSKAFTIGKASTVLTIDTAAQSVGIDGIESGISALLKDQRDTPLLQQTVYFTLTGGPAGPVTMPAITDNVGRARLGPVALPAGSYGITARFLGNIPTATGTLALTNPVYLASTVSRTVNLQGSPGCPTADFRRQLDVVGFCYLYHRVAGKVAIRNGTLVVGKGALVAGQIDQDGPGGVQVLVNGAVVGKIAESGPGDVIVQGLAGGKVDEAGPGDLVIGKTARVVGNVGETDDGSVTVSGSIGGILTEEKAGDLVITTTGNVFGKAVESGPGSLFNDGHVRGKAQQD